MIEKTALAYINLHAILGALPRLCELDGEARALIADEKISIGFAVRRGPSATLIFENGTCRMVEGIHHPTIKIPFSSPEKFNGMIDGTVTPIPVSGFHRIGFLLKKFMPLTDILTKYLRAEREALADPDFFEKSTSLMLCVIGGAIAQLANNDTVSRASASYIVDGNIGLSIGGGPEIYLAARDHRLTVLAEKPAEVLSYMRFADMKTARALFDGELNAVVAVGLGQVRIGGMISQIDNINRILDRVAVYLA